MIKILVLLSSSSFYSMPSADSIGKEFINGKVHVIHQVGEKETLYGISKRYGTTVEAILQQNPTADAGLEVGQILKVPYVSSPKKVKNGEKHIVAEKETLFSVARLYGLTVDELKRLNNISENTLSVGQALTVKKENSSIEVVKTTAVTQPLKGVHTVAEKETLFSISKQYSITIDQLKQWNNLTGSELKLGQKLFVIQPMNEGMQTTELPVETVPAQPLATETTKPANTSIKITEGYKDGKEIKETGLAELIEGTQGNRKYLALHRSASVGTILKIRNQMNDREVFVRVVGQLPATAQNDRVAIKISKSAYDRLGAIDAKFLVEVTWYK